MTIYLGRHPNPEQRLFDLLSYDIPRVGVDTETVSTTDHTVLGVGVAFTGEDAFYAAPCDEHFDVLMSVACDKGIRRVFHNAPFDIRTMRDCDCDPFNVDDTALMARLNCEPSAVLEDVSRGKEYANFDGSVGIREAHRMKEVLQANGVNKVVDLPYEALGLKCCEDAQATLILPGYFEPEIDMTYYEKLRKIIGKLEIISRVGIKIDHDRIEELYRIYSEREMSLRAICLRYRFNPSKNFEVGYVLAERGNFLPLTPSRKMLATDNFKLKKLKDPLAGVVLAWRDAKKKLSTYILPWLEADRAYTTLRMEAATGRVNSTNAGKTNPDRNLQNIPKVSDIGQGVTIRSAFIPDNRVFTKVDGSQMELRILANRSKDARMLAVFAADGDMHQDTVDGMWDKFGIVLPRTRAKNFNFGASYGADAAVLAQNIGTSDIAGTWEVLQAWYGLYEGAYRYFMEQEEFGMKHGYVTTTWGRKMRIPFDQHEKHARNCCRNYPIQGTAAEIIFELMNYPLIEALLPLIRLQVHDELIFDGRVEFPDMEFDPKESFDKGHPCYTIKKGELAYLGGFHLPLSVEYVERWG